jgi:hypothetical protein
VSLRGVPILVVLAVLLISSVPSVAAGVGPSATPSTEHAAIAARAAAAQLTPTAAPPASSGPGTFFSTSSVPAPPGAQRSCFATNCVTAADDPSLNLTSQGALVAAYTSWTTEAPCASARPYALTEVGIIVSTNLGSSWSSPAYLGNPDCTAPAVSEYPSAWQPSLASLSNGTLVLAYIEYNVSASSPFPPGLSFHASSPSVTYDRLVVTRSFDSGLTWTVPQVLNTSANPSLTAPAFPPVRPSVVATGDTVYVAWMNLTDSLAGAGSGSSAVQLVASTDGGVTFGSAGTLTTFGSTATSVAMNPSLAVDPTGRLFVAYASNLTYTATVGCPSSGCYNGGWTASVEIATSTTNGSSFSYSGVPGSVIVPPSRWGPFFDPSPVLAIGPSGSQVYVAFSSGYLTPLCSAYGCYTGFGATMSVSNSSTHGLSFSPARLVYPQLQGGSEDGADSLYNPAIGVTSNGVLQLSATFDNFSVCAPGYYGTFCGPQAQIYLNSTDNGTTFSAPIYVSDNSSQLYLDPNNPDGEYASLVTAGPEVLIAWTSDLCNGWNSTTYYLVCGWPGTGGASGVQISVLSQGTGLTLSFTETGLATGTTWTADALGNVRSGVAPTSLTVSGLPAGLNVTWNVTVQTAPGYRYAAAFSQSNPAIISRSTTVTVTYTPQVEFILASVPNLAAYPYGVPGCDSGFYWNVTQCPGVNWNITPAPGAYWVAPGSVIPVSVTPNDVLYCSPAGTCYSTDILNLTFLSWKGTGSGAANTTAFSTNVTLNGPVKETASFAYDGWCYYSWAPVFYQCEGPNATYGFHETGLPVGTPWTVTVSSGTQYQSNSSTTDWNIFSSSLNASLVNYTVSTIADGATGNYWVATSATPSPILAQKDPVVNVNFTLQALGQATFPIDVSTSNLPGGTSWGYSVDTASYGSNLPAAAPLDVTGGTHTISAAPVILSNSTRYLPHSIDTYDFTGSGSWSNFTTLPATIAVDGTTFAYLNYSTQYWLQATTSSCGNVSASSGWYASGATVTLTATAPAGCTFEGWSGTGPGSVTSSSRAILVAVDGPVSELAAFVPSPPPTWNVTLTEAGLPAGSSFTVGFGGQLYSGSGTFSIRALASGVYSLSLPYDYLNGTDGTRFLPSVTSTSLTTGVGGYLVDSNAWVNLTFAPQYWIEVSAGTGGTTTPSGATWYPAGTPLALTATPSDGYEFLGWAGSGPGAASNSNASFDLPVGGPASEVASFVAIPVPPTLTFGLTVTETGLAVGTSWSVEVGTSGFASSTGLVAVELSNGTYALELPIVAGPAGVRFLPDPMFTNVTVAGGPAATTVSYSTEYFVTVAASVGGSVNVSSGWFANGTVLSIAATAANASETFANWTGSGAGAYTGPMAAITITVAGPVFESAAFAPATSTVPTHGTSSGSSSNNGLLVSIGLLVGLLVVGVVVGMLLLRRRPPSAPEPATVDEEPMYGETPPPTEP